MAPAPDNAQREAWLSRAVGALAPIYTEHDRDVPPVRVTCGWPSVQGLRNGNARVGECWDGESAEDGVPQVFISPVLRDTVKVLATLAHELVHAIVGNDEGHTGAFAKLARAIGLEGKLTATHAGEALEARLREIAERLGDYPHAALRPRVKETKQTTRLRKASCPECECIIRITAKWIDEAGEEGLLCPMPECRAAMVTE
jgi:hypothetical protein